MTENTTPNFSSVSANSTATPQNTSSINWKAIVLVVLLSIVVIATLLWWKNSQSSQNDQPDSSTTQSETATVGVVIRSTTGDELPPVQTIDQTALSVAIQAAWTEAIAKAPQNAVTFPNDPNLVAFQIKLPDQEEAQSFVVYANRPVIVETNLVETLPNNQAYQLDFDRENYQLLIKFAYTPQVTALDLTQVLTEAFNQILNHRRLPADQENNPLKILAFEALL